MGQEINFVVCPIGETGPCNLRNSGASTIELKDGRLLMLGRTRLGRIYQSFSKDYGKTWSEAEPTMLAASESPQVLRRIPETPDTKRSGCAGDLLLVWNQSSQDEIEQGLGRMRLSCAISKDNGKRWEFYKNIESLDDTAYIEPFNLGSFSP